MFHAKCKGLEEVVKYFSLNTTEDNIMNYCEKFKWKILR